MSTLQNTTLALLERLASGGDQVATALVDLFKHRPFSAKFTVAAEASGHIDTTIQLLDLEGHNLAQQDVITVWVSDTAGGAATAQVTLTTTVQTGTLIVAETANKVLKVMTDNTGKAVIRIADTAKSYFLNTTIDGLESSATITLS